MMKFDRPIGAKADVAELRYVSALLQTCPGLREDGSVHQADVSALLASKYSLKLSDDEVQAIILNGMSAGSKLTGDIDGDAQNQMIDMCEVVAALIIPELLNANAAKHNDEGDLAPEEGAPSDMLNIVLDILKEKHGRELIFSGDIMKKILVELGEVELAQNDDLVRDMVRLAGQPNNKEQNADPNILDAESLAHALTSDVQAYDEEECSSSDGLLATLESSCKCQRLQVSDNGTETQSMGPAVANVLEGISVDGVVGVEGKTQDGGANHDNADDDKPGAKRIISTKSIDYFTDDQASRLVAVALWLFLLLHILASGSLNLQDFPSFVPSDVCEPSVGCDILEATLSWIDSILTLLIIGGIFTMGFGSLGNRAGAPQIAVILSLIPAVYFFVKPFTNIGMSPGDLQGEPHRQFAIVLSMVMAFVIILERMRQLAYLNFLKTHIDSGSRLARIVSCGFTGTENERLDAACYKMNRMLRNACQITNENPNESHQDRVVTFYEKADAVEKVGGRIWVWRRMKDRTLYCREGIRFSARLLAANIMQFFIIGYIILFVKVTTERVVEQYETSLTLVVIRSAQTTAKGMVDNIKNLGYVATCILDIFYTSVFPALESLRQDGCQTLANSKDGTLAEIGICSSNSTYLSDLQAESEEFKSLIVASLSTKIDPVKNFIKSAIDTGADILATTAVIVDPIEPWMIQMAFGIGGLVAFFASIFLAITYLPSVASTTLKFRSGVLPSLDDPKRFNSLYRGRMHHVTLLTGAIFWGSLCYVAILSFAIGFIILAVIWIGTIMHAVNASELGIGGVIIGSVVTFLAQFFLFGLSARSMYNAFYRRRPGWANIHNLLWEAIWIGLSILFVALRAIKLTVVAALQIGRVDIPFLADGVGVYGGFMLDRFPIIFRQDILAHEAHSHPFIERLGRLYLLKIRHGEQFASTAGNCWRLVFVLTLFPWLKKYRVIQCPVLIKQSLKGNSLKEMNSCNQLVDVERKNDTRSSNV